MLLIEITRQTPYKSEELISLIGDVPNYGVFIPWVKAVKIWDKESDKRFKAELLVGFKAFRIPFSTQVDINSETKTVRTDLVSKPSKGLFDLSNQLKSLTCVWNLIDTENGCNIQLRIDFDFKDAILRALANANLERAKNRLVEIFIKEADRRFAR